MTLTNHCLVNAIISAAAIGPCVERYQGNYTVYTEQFITQLSIMHSAKQDVLPARYCVSWSYK